MLLVVVMFLPSPSIEHANSSFSILFNDNLRQNDDTALFIRDQYNTSFCESIIYIVYFYLSLIMSISSITITITIITNLIILLFSFNNNNYYYLISIINSIIFILLTIHLYLSIYL